MKRATIITSVIAATVGFGSSIAVQAGLVHAPDANSILLWHMDEAAPVAGDDLADASGNGLTGFLIRDGIDTGGSQTTFLDATGVKGDANGALQLTPSIQDQANASEAIPGGTFGGGDFTVEFWVTGFDDADLSGNDDTFGAPFVSNERLLGAVSGDGEGWGFGLNSDGEMMVGSDTVRSTFTSGLDWVSSTWYYVALVVDTAGGGVGTSSFTAYRSPLGGPFEQVGSTVLNDIVASGQNLTLGDVSGDPASREFDRIVDEVHFSDIARSETYLFKSTFDIPEPSTVFLTLVGAGILGLQRKRNRR